MKILNSNQLREIDKYTIEQEGVPAIELVRRVARGVAVEIENRWTNDTRIIVFAGWGNNGADALATAEILYDHGFSPEIYLFNIGGDRLSPLCQQCRNSLLELFPEARLFEITGQLSMPQINADCVVVDGLFGSGLNEPLNSAFQMLVRNINESRAYIISIDIPSGLMSEWNEMAVNRNIIHADLTLAVQLPRLAFLMSENNELVGQWKVLNIDLSHNAIRRSPYVYFLIEKRDIKRLLPRRGQFTSKADYGNAMICAGSYGMMGASVLAARGCLRAGVGRLTLYAPKCGYNILQTSVPCATYEADPADFAISQIVPKRAYNAIAIGPGIGTSDATIMALENILKVSSANSHPLVLDADALNCIALRPTMLDYLPGLSILTPHAGEFDRIFGPHHSTEARIKKAIEKAQFYNVFIILKGRYTAVVRPDGKVFFNSSGTPAMATPGSGDVLTGIITALMAQGHKPEMASVIGTFIHGVAGELAEAENGSYGVTADDIARNVGKAIAQIMD